MKTIKVRHSYEIPKDYTGIVEWENGDKIWLKDGYSHREDGPAYVGISGHKEWYLNDMLIWNSYHEFDLTNKIILSKTKHPEYLIVQVWKILDSEGIYEQIVIPGMEEYIQE